MTTRKPCVNAPTATYSGKEQSPLHFGLSAEGYDLNTVFEGHDKLMWTVKMKNGRKVWIRNIQVGPNGIILRMVHEEPVIQEVIHETKEDVIEEEPNPRPTKAPVMKAIVEEKKITDYNMFLTYRLCELKKEKASDKTNKELFNQAVAEWKELKKNAVELKNVLELAKSNKN